MSEHNVTLVFEDGRAVRIPSKESETIYLSALKRRIRLETDCREGTCATCKGVCTSGDYVMDDYIDEALTADEAARGEVLTCRMHATSDCVIEMPYDSGLAMKGEPESRQARVAAVEEVAKSVVRLEVEPEGGAPMPFLPGQYVHLSVPGTDERRSYSFANPPGDGPLVFYLKILERGAMSDYVSGRAKPGDEMTITGPYGRFYLRPPTRPILMVAGGTGLAPMLSMLQHLAASGRCGQKIHLLYGANTPDELFATDRFAGPAGAGLDLTVEFSAVEPDAAWSGAAGHVTSLLRRDLLNGGDCDVYLCGPPPMIEAAERWLAGQGIDARNVHAEKFLPS